ncbi:HNH endonuclease domain-containing protein [Vibrio sp. MEBiC08052]|uniref:HNH endonuclease domain-containing protein n=1 Tax=Vibrio sp. MEBiC08052 TaxID=1761910 RepID=UPI00074058DE|nr:HNH endonuclease domain-containing protein [Vibrio sp. MEBiC08052]KUJ00071.1 hypothetical protein VRK_07830 [Vibrio sp. MEBiC08052]
MTFSPINELKHLSSSLLSEESAWSWSDQVELAGIKPPDMLMGIRRDLLQGDISREWVKWVIEQFIDHKYLKSNCSYVWIFSDIYKNIESLIGLQASNEVKMDIAKIISKLVKDRIDWIKSEYSRKSFSVKLKEDLLDAYMSEGKVRCWLTGYEFSKDAIFNFQSTKSDKVKINLPEYVDRIRPIGLTENDLRIEIDHLYPYSLGGNDSLDNYRLVCGWANRVKSNNISGYSLGTKINQKVGIWPKSYYYWIIRLIGLRRKCEEKGCKNHLGNSELTVESIFGPDKAITPTSMKVVCYKHSKLPNRFIKREIFSNDSFGGYANEIRASL